MNAENLHIKMNDKILVQVNGGSLRPVWTRGMQFQTLK